MRIQDIMTRDPACVTPEATAREAAQVMLREEVGLVPVVEKDGSKRLVGVVTDRDLAIRCVAEGKDGSCSVRDVMSSDSLATCRQSDDVDTLMGAMRSEKVRRIPIVDERGGLVGIVSQADIVRKAKDSARAEETIEEISEPGGRHAS
jgi:CBS domain-containing protein